MDNIITPDKGKTAGLKDKPIPKISVLNISQAGKRLSDIFLSGFGLLLFSAVFGVIALLIRRDSPGPVFFRGRRVGLNGKEFNILKFRTMYERDASYQGPRLTANGDQRVTPLGRWLRRTKLNELPQLWNVLNGEMSMVGPRPEDPEYAMRWPEDIRQEVLSMRPGLTSPASIIYRDEEEILNSNSILDDYFKRILPEKLRLDQLYVHNHTLLGDIDVIFLTAIMLLPRLRDQNIQEKTLFSGPFYNFINHHLSWFLIDTLVALIAITVSGVIWRLYAPLDIGIINSFFIAVIIAVLLGISNFLFGLRRITWRYASSAYVFDIFLSTVITTLIIFFIEQFALPEQILPTPLLINFGILTFIGMVAVRYRERLMSGFANRWISWRGGSSDLGERVLIVGAGEGGQLAIWLIQKSTFASAFSIFGFVDDNFHKHNRNYAGYPVLGSTYDIPDIVKQHKIGIILFSIEKCSAVDRSRIINQCRKTSARLVVIPDFMKSLERSMRQAVVEEVQ